MDKVDLMIVGAQKAGTTSLINYLKQHDQVEGPMPIEFTFFSDRKQYEKGFPSAYDQFFQKKNQAKLIVAKNVTLAYDQEALKRLRLHNPNCKIVFLMREPCSRAYSAFKMAKSDGWMDQPFDTIKEVIESENKDHVMYKYFLEYGLYIRQLTKIINEFGAAQVRVYLFEDFTGDPKFVLQDLAEWASIRTTFNIDFNQIYNATYTSRSSVFSRFLISLRSEKNLLKRAIRTILPYSIFHKTGQWIVSLSKTNNQYEVMSPIARKVLDEFYKDSNAELRQFFQNQGKNCLITNGDSNWLLSSQ